MNAQVISRKELGARLVQAEERLDAAVAELEVVEQEAAQLAVSGSTDEVGLARLDKKLSAARAKVSSRQEQVRHVESAMQIVRERDELEELAAAHVDRVAQLRIRAQKADKVHEATKVLAGALLDLFEDNGETFKAFPRAPRSELSYFDPYNVQLAIELWLYGLSDRRWRPKNAGLETPSTARELPTLGDRIRAENEQILQEFAPRGTQPPRAA